MAAVELGARELEPFLTPFAERLSIAAVNSARSSVVSGAPEAVDACWSTSPGADFRRRVRVDYASHGAHVEVIREEILRSLADIKPRSSSIPLYSTVSGELLDGSELGASYWYRNLRGAVRFADAVQQLLSSGHRCFIEVSPHPVLNLTLHETLDCGISGRRRRFAAARRRRPHSDLLSLCELYVRRIAPDWHRILPHARRVALPSYAFQRQRHWLDAPRRPATDVSAAGLISADHPLLGAMVALANGEGFVFTSRLALSDHAWLGGHVVFGTVLCPVRRSSSWRYTPRIAWGSRASRSSRWKLRSRCRRRGPFWSSSPSARWTNRNRSLTVHARSESAAHGAPWTRHAMVDSARAARLPHSSCVPGRPRAHRRLHWMGCTSALPLRACTMAPTFEGCAGVGAWRGSRWHSSSCRRR